MRLRTWCSYGLAAWALASGLVAGAAAQLWTTVAWPLLLLTVIPLLFLGFIGSGALAAAWVPAWPMPLRAAAAACGGFWLHFAVLYTVGAAAQAPLASPLEPFGFTAPRHWFALCALAAVAGLAAVVQARPSKATPGLPSP